MSDDSGDCADADQPRVHQVGALHLHTGLQHKHYWQILENFWRIPTIQNQIKILKTHRMVLKWSNGVNFLFLLDKIKNKT